jgi:hypothetical protein
VGNSNTTRLRVAHWGSGTLVGSGPIARWTNPRAAADANSLADSAASAGHRKAKDVNWGLSDAAMN